MAAPVGAAAPRGWSVRVEAIAPTVGARAPDVKFRLPSGREAGTAAAHRMSRIRNSRPLGLPRMEVMLRCEVADEPGRLAELAGAIGEAGGDIQGVDVVGHARDGRVIDDLVVVGGADTLRRVVKLLDDHPHVRVVHAGPSRGHPGDAVTRLSVGLEALFNGSTTPEDGVRALVGGLLQASSVTLVPAGEAPMERAGCLVLPMDHRTLVVARDYPFTDHEQERARALVRMCGFAVHHLR